MRLPAVGGTSDGSTATGMMCPVPYFVYCVQIFLTDARTYDVLAGHKDKNYEDETHHPSEWWRGMLKGAVFFRPLVVYLHVVRLPT